MDNNIEKLENQLSGIKSFMSKEQGKKEKLLEQINKYREDNENISKEIDLLEEVVILYQKTAEFAREQAKVQIEGLVTKCLQFIFESDGQFSIEIEELRNKANAEFYIVDKVDDITVKTKPELSRGGGIVDIVSLALRIAFLEIHKPRIQGPLILDEPAKHVSEDYISNVGEFLDQSSKMFNRQIIMVTHNQHLSSLSDNSYRVDLTGSTSLVTDATL